MPTDIVLLPLKQFDLAKERLRRAGTVDATAIARALATAVITACRPRRIVIVGENVQLERFAAEHGVEYFESAALELNGAVHNAYRRIASSGSRIFVVHGDLREPAGLGTFEPEDGVTVVTDHHGSGTPVLVLPGGMDFHFHYGPDSALLHRLEAQRLGVNVHVIGDSVWSRDVDEVNDL